MGVSTEVKAASIGAAAVVLVGVAVSIAGCVAGNQSLERQSKFLVRQSKDESKRALQQSERAEIRKVLGDSEAALLVTFRDWDAVVADRNANPKAKVTGTGVVGRGVTAARASAKYVTLAKSSLQLRLGVDATEVKAFAEAEKRLRLFGSAARDPKDWDKGARGTAKARQKVFLKQNDAFVSAALPLTRSTLGTTSTGPEGRS